MRDHRLVAGWRAKDEAVVRVLDAAGEPLLLKGLAHRRRVGVGALPRGDVLPGVAHAEEVEVEERQVAGDGVRHRVVDRALAEHPHLEPAPRGLVVEVHERGACRGAGHGPLADLHHAVGHVGREVALEHLDENNSLVGAYGVGQEARVEARGGGDVAPAELADRLAHVGGWARHWAEVLLGV